MTRKAGQCLIFSSRQQKKLCEDRVINLDITAAEGAGKEREERDEGRHQNKTDYYHVFMCGFAAFESTNVNTMHVVSVLLKSFMLRGSRTQQEYFSFLF